MTITEPGIVTDLDERTYHADRTSLSHSGSKNLHDSPARFRWLLDNRVEKDSFDVGTLAHKLILKSTDNRIRVADTYDWRTKKWQDWKREQHAAGLVPVHRGDLRAASKMAAAVRRHTLASAILNRPGQTEISVYGDDPVTGTQLRARYDRITVDDDGQPLIVDVKTSALWGPDGFARQAFRYGYHTQAAWYADLAVLAGLTKRAPRVVFIVVETAAPHFVHVHEFDDEALSIARIRNRAAIDLYTACLDTDTWPAYPEVINLTPPPAWLYDDDMEID